MVVSIDTVGATTVLLKNSDMLTTLTRHSYYACWRSVFRVPVISDRALFLLPPLVCRTSMMHPRAMTSMIA